MRQGGRAVVSDIDETGVTAELHGRTFKVARYCAHGRVGPRDGGEGDQSPASDRSDEMELYSSSVSAKRKGSNSAYLAGKGGVSELITGSPGPVAEGNIGSNVSSTWLSVQAPFPPSLSVHVPPSPFLSGQVPQKGSPFERN